MAKKTIRFYPDTRQGFPKKDLLGNLHCENGPAMHVCTEDWKGEGIQIVPEVVATNDQNFAYFYHGIHIPSTKDNNLAELIIEHPEKLTVEFVDSIQNIEIQRVALERLGYERYLSESKDIQILHRDIDDVERPEVEGGMERILIQKSLPDGQKLTGVFVYNRSPNGKFTNVKTNLRPLTDYAEHERARIVRKYENTGNLVDVNGLLHIKETLEEGDFIPDRDHNGKLVYKRYFLSVDAQLRPFWFKLNKDGIVELNRDKDPISEYGEPQEMTCHNAVASTLGLYGDEYVLDEQS